MRLKIGDTVKVISGKDAGKESKIARVYPKANKIIVENVATAKRHQRANPQNPNSGGIIDKDMPIDASNVMIVCEDCGPTRIGMTVAKDGTKKRVCRKCGGEL
ncbi:MAG: 50S ribosomal protein L24 [Acidimicrobiia bacterium]|nr:50S ribosomal protein L24 [Acidimicrobiia bacterium]